MMAASRDERLETILEAFTAAFDIPPPHEKVREWAARHPDFADEIAAYAAEWAVMEALAPPAASLAPDPAAVARGMTIVAQSLDPPPPIATLLDAAREAHRDIAAVAAETGLSPRLLQRLDRRLIDAARLPDLLIARLARALNRTAADVRAYLGGPPLLPQGAQFRADRAPAAAQQDFFAAIRSDPTLSAALKAEWLALEPPGHAA